VSANSVPLLKPPVWTWEVPAYLFVGGVAGISAVIALVAGLAGADETLARDARFVALAGGLLSPLFLISDLGRPGRFLYMLRVFKRQSAMSVGAWTLVVFGGAVAGSVVLRMVASADAGADTWPGLVVLACDALGALTGLVLVTYTGVLLGATAIPIWAANARVLPWLFTATSLGAAASLLELLGHRATSLHTLAILAAVMEIVASLGISGFTKRPTLLRTSELFAGAVPLILRLLALLWAPARTLAGVSAIAGGALSRVAWIAAGRVSAAESRG
jgi:formate-dependent nitrite reductase membrane component NrfD